MYIHPYTNTPAHSHTHIHTYIHTYTHITHTHTHTTQTTHNIAAALLPGNSQAPLQGRHPYVSTHTHTHMHAHTQHLLCKGVIHPSRFPEVPASIPRAIGLTRRILKRQCPRIFTV